MNDLASLNGKPTRALRVGDREYKLYPLTFDDMAELQSWVNTTTPDPLAIASHQIGLDRFTVEQGKYLLKVAMELAAKGPPKLGTEEADAMLQSSEGIKEVVYLSVRKGDPSFNREAATALFRQVTQGDIATLFGSTGLVEACVVAAEPPDPKAGGSGTTTTDPPENS